MFAPQWAAFVQAALGWPELEEAIGGVHAHTKDQGWTVDAEIREEWTAAAAERTPLAADELVEGAVDVAWFVASMRCSGRSAGRLSMPPPNLPPVGRAQARSAFRGCHAWPPDGRGVNGADHR